MRRNNLFLAMNILFSVILIPLASAENIFSRGSRAIFRGLQNEGMQAAITIFIIWIIIYSILSVAIKNVKIFNDEGKVNNSGKIFAISVSLLAVIGLFFARRSMHEVVRNILDITQIYGTIVLMIIIFILTYNLLKGGEKNE